MSYNVSHQTKKTVRVRGLFVPALVLGCAFGTVTNASAQKLTAPTTPLEITPPVGNSLFLSGHAKGTQGYICLPTSPGAPTASWTVKGIGAARPEATLFASFVEPEVQIITHFLSPDTKPNKFAPAPLPFGSATWQSSVDSSRVWAQKQQGIPAGSDPTSCPNTGAIDCLLLQAIGTDHGPTGGQLLAHTTFVQRLNTKGGSAPVDGCSDTNDVGKQTLVPYSADYFFYRADDGDEEARRF